MRKSYSFDMLNLNLVRTVRGHSMKSVERNRYPRSLTLFVDMLSENRYMPFSHSGRQPEMRFHCSFGQMNNSRIQPREPEASIQ
ncbi:MAG: hypothetical protein BWK80_29950 [Desulfobacteraceae bacterium IS3]|nr:MAG: hypothetical protein BWK80_29950 [Desulfobacteraceae bacterium IS3]